MCFKPVEAQESSSSSLVRGLQFYNSEKFDQAMDEFSSILRKDPSNLEALYYQGLTLAKAEKFESAKETFEKVLKLDPKYKGARLQLGIVFFKLKSHSEAIKELEKVLENDRENATAHLFMGFALQGIEKYEESLIFLQTAMSLDPSLNQISYFQIGVGYLESQKQEEAKLAFQLVLEEDPETATAEQAKEMLKLLGVKSASDKNWWIKAEPAFQIDDNVIVSNQDIVSNERDKSKSYLVGLGANFEPFKNAEVEIGYDFSQTRWDKLPQFDSTSHDFYTTVGYGSGNWDGDISFNYNYSFLDRADLAATHSITPRLGYSPTPNFYTNLSYTYNINDYFVGNDRDGKSHVWSLMQFWFFMEQKAYMFASYSFDMDDTEELELDYLGHSATGGVKIPGPFQISAQFTYNYYLKKFQNINSAIGDPRFDSKHTLNFLLNRPIIKNHIDIDLGYTRVMSNSNLLTLDFKQNVYLIGLNFKL
ncbi:MAG: tetratricopeptide repeat protein [Nitrospinae bacterium]|nr:tetratricopeptide repeat protein [Nitrospinota bacterium]